MRRIVACVILLCMSFLGGCAQRNSIPNMNTEESKQKEYDIAMKRDIFCIMLAFPGYVTGVKQEGNGNVYILMKSGKQLLYDDKKSKSFNDKLNNADLQDMMELEYPLSDIKSLMDNNNDPGRIRSYPLLAEVYGSSKHQVQSNLTNVNVGGKRVQFNKNNNASQALSAVMKELDLLMQKKKGLYSFVFPTSGTFNYRVIAGTGLLSPHSFGIAIDLARDKRDYWMWASRKEGQKRLDMYPPEIVKVFEDNNFVWGGKWSHFDILHYEYRPEIILKSRYFPGTPDIDREWYEGPHLEYSEVKDYIDMIDSAFK